MTLAMFTECLCGILPDQTYSMTYPASKKKNRTSYICSQLCQMLTDFHNNSTRTLYQVKIEKLMSSGDV